MKISNWIDSIGSLPLLTLAVCAALFTASRSAHAQGISPTPTNAPAVTILAPANGQVFFAPASIAIQATTSMPGEVPVEVEFFANGVSIGVATNNPLSGLPVNLFHLAWTNVAAGNYALTAVAIAKDGVTATSQPVNIIVSPATNAGPVVIITAPTNSQSFAAPANILISASIADANAFANVISFYSGTNLITTLILDPLPGQTNTTVQVGYPWQNVPAGAYSLTVVATDTHGVSGTSAPVNVSVVGSTPPITPVVTIFATDPIAVEGSNSCFVPPVSVFTNFFSGTNTATFLVLRAGDTNSDLTVGYSIGGTASNGVNYAELPGEVTIPAGQRFALITIIPLEVPSASAAKRYWTVILGLNPPPPPPTNTPPAYHVGWPGKAAAIILEDCFLPLPVAEPLDGQCFRAGWPFANGQNYSLEISTDLMNWTPVLTNTVVKSSAQFIDPEAADFPNRFYRAVPVAGPGIY